jgi:hypothetical protein
LFADVVNDLVRQRIVERVGVACGSYTAQGNASQAGDESRIGVDTDTDAGIFYLHGPPHNRHVSVGWAETIPAKFQVSNRVFEDFKLNVC